ncbi:ABC transporter substrate-binding protein [Actinoalloteichus spitiensis]|uniref:ABC transporter substrate-binding protein n=1 Tax=Actinoalloteichus spitiensis TaxID=252394 RepID=UPI00037789EE|nr:ABC transporter substrate-binding protein [Actinoalloteichus spitiensis]
MNLRSRLAALPALSLIGVAALAGCANREEAADPSAATATQQTPATQDTTEAGFPVEVTLGDTEPVTIDQRPTSIVSLTPTATEMLFAIGAGDSVVAADTYSDYPPEAPTTELDGISPNIEAVSEYQPDLVISSGDSQELLDAMAAIDVPVLVVGTAGDLEDSYQQLVALGEATGNQEAAEALVADMRAEIDQIVTSTETPEEPLTYYHELDQTFYSITSGTFAGQVYDLFGLENIADAADGGDYPQLSPEFILEADPDLIFLADTKCCGQSAQTVAERPGWDTLSAVQEDGIIELDDDLASRWGPRVVEFAEAVGAAVNDVTARTS